MRQAILFRDRHRQRDAHRQRTGQHAATGVDAGARPNLRLTNKVDGDLVSHEGRIGARKERYRRQSADRGSEHAPPVHASQRAI